MDKLPWFPFHPGDWLDKRVLRMDYDAQGIYMRLLCHMWRDARDQCSIENDDAMLMRLLGLSRAKFRAAMAQIQWRADPIFKLVDGRFISARLQRVKREQDASMRERSEAGKKAAAARWQSQCERNANASKSQCDLMLTKNQDNNNQEKEKEQPAAQAAVTALARGSNGNGTLRVGDVVVVLPEGRTEDEILPGPSKNILTALGFTTKHAYEYAMQYPVKRVLEVARMCEGKAKPVGFAVDAFRKGWTP